MCSSPLTILVALCWVHSSFSTFFFCYTCKARHNTLSVASWVLNEGKKWQSLSMWLFICFYLFLQPNMRLNFTAARKHCLFMFHSSPKTLRFSFAWLLPTSWFLRLHRDVLSEVQVFAFVFVEVHGIPVVQFLQLVEVLTNKSLNPPLNTTSEQNLR